MYDIEKEKEKQSMPETGFEQSANSQRKPEQCKELGTGRYVWRWIFYYDAETFQDGSGKAEYGAGEI